MDFIHCKKCGHWPQLYPEIRLKYFMTACGQLYCESCLQNLNNKCGACEGKRACKVIEINAQSSVEIKSYFMDPSEILQNNLKKIIQVINFQQHLRRDGMAIIGRMAAAHKNMKTEMTALRNEKERILQENEALQHRISELQSKVNELESQKRSTSTSFTMLPSPTLASAIGRVNENNDPLNLFAEPAPRPVQPIKPQHSPLPHSSPPPQRRLGDFRQQEDRNSSRNVFTDMANNHNAYANAGASSFQQQQNWDEFGRRSPSSINSSPSAGFGTPASSVISSISSPILRSSERIRPGGTQTPLSTPLVSRLRNLRCVTNRR